MGRLLFVLVLLASSNALDAAFAKGGLLHLFSSQRASPPTISEAVSSSNFLGGCGSDPARAAS